jgi:hypothetical protein
LSHPHTKQNEPIEDNKSRPNAKLVHVYGPRKRISNPDLQKLALKIYNTNGRGITYPDLINTCGYTKKQAQRKLKNVCVEKRDKNGRKTSTLFTLDNERTNPQQYFPSSIKAKVIENKRNRLIGTTGVSYSNNLSSFPSSSHYPLYNAIEHHMVSYFITQLSLLPFQPLYMHNIHLWMIVDKSNYEEINQKPWYENNKTKIQKERVGVREVVFQFHKKGSIEIGISSSKHPFKIETDNDVNNFFIFLGKVQDRLAYILSDPRERIVPPIDNWILKSCDFNKDIEIDHRDIGQLLDLNMQIKHVGKAFRLYIKNLEDTFVLRGERTMKVDQSITTFMNDSILHPYHLIKKEFDELKNIILQKLNEKNRIKF